MAKIVSRPSDPDGYLTGEKITVVVETEEAVSAEGRPWLGVEIGNHVRLAYFSPVPEDNWSPERPSRTWRFEYTVAGDDLDLDGISISPMVADESTFLLDGHPVWVFLTVVLSGDVSRDNVRPGPGRNLFDHRVTRPREPRVCTDERELATNSSVFSREWDGTPFRVEMVRNFPDSVTEADARQVLELLGLLAERIEDQLGYPIIEAGGFIPVPADASTGWDTFYPRDRDACPLSRDRGQIQLYHLDHRIPIVLPFETETEVFAVVAVEAFPRCGAIAVNLVALQNLDRDAEIAQQVFYLLGFQDPWDAPDSEQGVPMSDSLYKAWRAGLESVRWSDIDALRCIFPEGG